MTRLLALSGSLRAASLNTALARAAQQLTPEGVEIDVATLHGVPLYDGDLEAAEGMPAAVLALQARILAADGLLLVTPEYNNGVPGVFKNGIDWLSRTGEKTLFAGRPTALMGASPGGFGTLLSQTAWLATLKSLGAPVYSGGRLLLSRAHTLIDAEGQLGDPAARRQVAEFVAGFVDFARRSAG